MLGNLKSSLVAGTICTVTTNPYWVVFTSYQIQKKNDKGEYKGVLDIMMDIIKNEGILGFWKGIGPAVVLVVNPVI